MLQAFSEEQLRGDSRRGTVFSTRLDSKGLLRVVYCQARIVVMLHRSEPNSRERNADKSKVKVQLQGGGALVYGVSMACGRRALDVLCDV